MSLRFLDRKEISKDFVHSIWSINCILKIYGNSIKILKSHLKSCCIVLGF